MFFSRKIIKFPNKILSTPSVEVTLEKGRKTIDELRDIAGKVKWGTLVGLAAPQIGKNERVFIAFGKAFINPQIIYRSPKKKICLEGCYSLEENKFDYPVERSETIRVKWMNEHGVMNEYRYRGFESEVIQHEFDHLEGKLCCQ